MVKAPGRDQLVDPRLGRYGRSAPCSFRVLPPRLFPAFDHRPPDAVVRRSLRSESTVGLDRDRLDSRADVGLRGRSGCSGVRGAGTRKLRPTPILLPLRRGCPTQAQFCWSCSAHL